MKKLNRILILLALLSFVSCGTASMYEDEDIEVSNTNTDEQKNFDKAAAAENQQQYASESAAEKTETAGTAGEEAQEEKDPNYEGGKYVGPAAADFEEGLHAYADGGCEKAVKFWKSAFDKDQKNANIAFNTAVCFERMKNKAEAEAWYEKA